MRAPHAPDDEKRRKRRFGATILLTFALGLGVPAGLSVARLALGPLDVSLAAQGSTIAVARDGRLLRGFTASDGRWRLPMEVGDVDPRFLSLLQSYEDRRFLHHHGVDPLAMARAAGQVLRHAHVISGGSTLTMQVARLLEPRARLAIACSTAPSSRAS